MSQVASLPRVIDYWLGGPQHTPADAAEGDRLAGLHPDAPRLYQGQRQFQRHILQTMSDAGLAQFLIFKAGLPTAGHAHEQLDSAKIYYTDDDFDVVQPGAGLLAGVRRRVRYQTLDATDPENLEDLEFSPVLKTDQPIGILLSGACERWDDNTLQTITTNLYGWAQPGSMLAFTHAGLGARDLLGYFAEQEETFTLRSPEMVTQLSGGWDLKPHTLEGLPEWLSAVVATR